MSVLDQRPSVDLFEELDDTLWSFLVDRESVWEISFIRRDLQVKESCEDWRLKEVVSLLRIFKDERELAIHLLAHLLERIRLQEERGNELKDLQILKELVVLSLLLIESLFVLKHRIDELSDQDVSLGL